MDSYDVVVIGGGPAGIAAAGAAAAAGASVALIEQEKLGGTCVNATCIPTEIFLNAANSAFAVSVLTAEKVLADIGAPQVGALSRRKRALVREIGESLVRRLRDAGIAHLSGHASFVDAHTIAVESHHRIRAGSVVLATGARWRDPTFDGVPADAVVTPDVVQEWTQVPATALVVGGRNTGLVDFAIEYAYLLAALGSEATFATAGDRVVAGLDADLQHYVVDALETIGCSVRLEAPLTGSTAGVVVSPNSPQEVLQPDCVVMTDVRYVSLEGLNSDAAGLDSRVPVRVDERLATAVPHIYAAGDLIGGSSLTTSAQRSGRIAGTNAAGGAASYPEIVEPVVLRLHTDIAFAGIDEQTAVQRHGAVKVGFLDLDSVPGNLISGAIPGAVKVIAGADGNLLGVHAVGSGAAQIAEAAAAFMQTGTNLGELAAMPVWHPSPLESLANAAKMAAVTSS
ncbi:NAD(P)/FAD-dependent oxidoreductase [Mycolicibacillus parakoreensis]|uniref:FAD-dependent oxidoreductase n=1 Tax=Mycolicibacillus parakoreensis TaxID=1069221 RepID=A0ABY3U4V6_9MYCO|nr:FAD-dependent oxidoreductase [Mycolicibacillus parakoreensis]MCV7316564.1 NAD(P)/FAD-dependent oxidoreductase [Mycolicibacillus parakoreensis]ULN52786.1 FAD-dependent oxidoreductase [Mycolicibacillus parakoreensis]HLR99981.1 FAD-dependent oxidoreductase [Mycolicibacillus parakoreensis]